MNYIKAKYTNSNRSYTYRTEDAVSAGGTVVTDKGAKLTVVGEADMAWVESYGADKVAVVKKYEEPEVVKMTPQELAEKINNREYECVVTRDTSALAKQNRLVIVYGASDDLMEFDGAIYDEVGCYDGGVVRVGKNGVCENCEADYIEALWCKNADDTKSDVAWQYNTQIPHATFNILEDGEIYCVGIVFSIDDLKEPAAAGESEE